MTSTYLSPARACPRLLSNDLLRIGTSLDVAAVFPLFDRVGELLSTRLTPPPGTSTSIATLVKMMESLSASDQDCVVERAREYIEDLRDEERWDRSFERSQAKLAAVARRAKEDIQ